MPAKLSGGVIVAVVVRTLWGCVRMGALLFGRPDAGHRAEGAVAFTVEVFAAA
jgi:hypothetical protein